MINDLHFEFGFNLMTIHVINDQKLVDVLLLRATVCCASDVDLRQMLMVFF
jgi:hypothetical protein